MMEDIKNNASTNSLVGVYTNIQSTELMTVNTFKLVVPTSTTPEGSLSLEVLFAASLALLSGAVL